MSTSKHIDKICMAVIALTLVITILFMCGESLGIAVIASAMPYESTLFDTSYVHQIDIVMNDWESFIESCESEEYTSCTVVIDGEKHSNIAIRAKGNTSLSTVSSLDSDRYSFKLEFDHYESGNTMDGLDKLCLNNLIQDNTMMKDYIVYQMMRDFGVDTPLCSFAYLTVNGEDWGLYLAIEGVEDSFLSRNYGSEVGELYKPDSMSFGGGRGNGKDFDFEDLDFDFDDIFGSDSETSTSAENDTAGIAESDEAGSENLQGMTLPSFSSNGDGQTGELSFPNGQGGAISGQSENGGMSFPGGQMPDMSEALTEGDAGEEIELPEDGTEQGEAPSSGSFSADFSQSFGGMGSDDVKLQYIDDDPDSYSNIFDNAKTDITDADAERLIASLKSLSEYSDLENTVDTDEVLRYFVIHNFVCNGDSYTGSMIHNYYLYEEDGKLSMIPWDYNLAFGTFQGNNASDTVNTSIDSPISGGDVDDRPMLGWIFSSEEYTEEYHTLFSEFIEKWFTNGELEEMIDETAEMLLPYVEKDPTKFCTTEEFEAGVTALKSFVSLRAEAVSLQLAGNDTPVDTDDLSLSDMGTMNNGGGMTMPEDFSDISVSDLASYLTLQDEAGNEVEITSVIPDTATITSVTLADNSTVTLADMDMQTMAQLDVDNIISVADSDGNQYDLSSYTISTETPTLPGGTGSENMPSIPSMPDSGDSGNIPTMPSQEGDTTSKSSVTGENTSASFPSATENLATQAGEETDDETLASTSEDKDSGSEALATPPENSEGSESSGSGAVPSRSDEEKSQISMPDGMDRNGFSSSPSSDLQSWILIGVSLLVLALGLLVAIKKKH